MQPFKTGLGDLGSVTHAQPDLLHWVAVKIKQKSGKRHCEEFQLFALMVYIFNAVAGFITLDFN